MVTLQKIQCHTMCGQIQLQQNFPSLRAVLELEPHHCCRSPNRDNYQGHQISSAQHRCHPQLWHSHLQGCCY